MTVTVIVTEEPLFQGAQCCVVGPDIALALGRIVQRLDRRCQALQRFDGLCRRLQLPPVRAERFRESVHCRQRRALGVLGPLVELALTLRLPGAERGNLFLEGVNSPPLNSHGLLLVGGVRLRMRGDRSDRLLRPCGGHGQAHCFSHRRYAARPLAAASAAADRRSTIFSISRIRRSSSCGSPR